MPQAELRGVLSCNNKPFINAMNDSVAKAKVSGKEMGGALSGIGGALKGVGAGMAAAFSIGAIASAGKAVFEFAGNLQDQADALGVSTTAMQGYAGVMEQSGVGQEKFTKGMTKLTQAMSAAKETGSPLLKSFEALGISIVDLKSDDASEILLKMADGLKAAGNSTEAFAAAMAILGKSGAGMIASLKLGREEFQKQADAVAKLTPDEIARLDSIGDAFTRMAKSAMVASGQAVSSLAELYEATDDKSIKGNEAGNKILPAWETIRDSPFGLEESPKNKIRTDAPTSGEISAARGDMEGRAKEAGRGYKEVGPQTGAAPSILEDQAKAAMDAMHGDAKNAEQMQDAEADRAAEKEAAAKDKQAAAGMARMEEIGRLNEQTAKRQKADIEHRLEMEKQIRKVVRDGIFDGLDGEKKLKVLNAERAKIMAEASAHGAYTAEQGLAYAEKSVEIADQIRRNEKEKGSLAQAMQASATSGHAPLSLGGLRTGGLGRNAHSLVRHGDAARARAARAAAGKDPALSKASATARNTAMIAKAFGVAGTEDL